MKIRNLLTLILLIGATMLVSCKKKGCIDPMATNYNVEAEKDDGSCIYDNNWYTEVDYNGTTYKQITGSLTEDHTLDVSSNWMISGGVFINSGVTLTIEAGTTVYTADDGSTPFLSISQGGMINACGTATDPIVFTPVSSTPSPGSWGGIILNGYAPINVGLTAEGEGGTGTYGGTNSTDNSGTMCYVRVEYAGKLLSTDNELNGFSFNGVGSATTLHHLQAYRGNDDGFEFFGGTVNLEYALSSGNGDDSFDWTHGWSGNGTNWIAEQDPTLGDRGIEADNNGSDNSALPMSSPTLNKITLIGRNAGDAMKLREGTAGTIDNVLIQDFTDAIDIEHDVTAQNVTSGSLIVTNVTTSNVVNNISVTATVGVDSTNTVTMGTNAVNGSGSGADSGWTSGWTKAL